jgi:enamine deaminase RidA (YjgF/YER057c/UK114 family)
MITRYNPPDAPPAARYSQVVRVDLPDARLMFISGLVAIDSDGHLVGPGDVVAQADQVYGNLETVLASQGAGLEHIVKVTTFLRDDVDPVPLGGRSRFPDDALPAATAVKVSSLADPAWLLEVEAVAVAPAG